MLCDVHSLHLNERWTKNMNKLSLFETVYYEESIFVRWPVHEQEEI